MNFYDYDAEMLKLYFEEKHYSKEKKQQLLETNPFNENYIIWEKQTQNNNKTFSIILKRKGLIKERTPIQEITVHKKNGVGNYLQNNIIYTTCSISEDINKIKLSNRLILMKGFYHNEYNFLKKLEYHNIPFITGICSKQRGYYLHILNEYQKMLKEFKNCELITEQNCDQYISILKTK